MWENSSIYVAAGMIFFIGDLVRVEVSAVMVISALCPVYAVLWVISAFLIVSAFFILLGLLYMGIIKIIVYVWAIAILYDGVGPGKGGRSYADCEVGIACLWGAATGGQVDTA